MQIKGFGVNVIVSWVQLQATVWNGIYTPFDGSSNLSAVKMFSVNKFLPLFLNMNHV